MNCNIQKIYGEYHRKELWTEGFASLSAIRPLSGTANVKQETRQRGEVKVQGLTIER